MLSLPSYREGLPTPAIILPKPANPFYIDTVSGTIGGNGTVNSPVNTIELARAACAGYPDQVFRIRAPVSAPLRAEFIFESSLQLTLQGYDSEPYYTYGSDVISNVWSGSGPVYFRTLNYTILTQVVVTSLTETIGGKTFYLKLLINTATPTIPGPGEFGYAGGILYVHLPDSSAASSHTFEIARRNTCMATRGFGKLTVEDAVARHALVNCLHNGLAGQPVGTGYLEVNDSLVEYAGNGGVGAAGQNEQTICNNVKSYRIANDGYNLHALTGQGYMELNDCEGSYCGDKAGQSSQGASNHEATYMVINGGQFNYNVSGGMVVIDTARCDLRGNILIDRNMRLGNTPGPVSLQASCAWMDTSSGIVTGNVTVSNGQGTGIKVNTPGNVVGANTIKSIGNALPDIGV